MLKITHRTTLVALIILLLVSPRLQSSPSSQGEGGDRQTNWMQQVANKEKSLTRDQLCKYFSDDYFTLRSGKSSNTQQFFPGRHRRKQNWKVKLKKKQITSTNSITFSTENSLPCSRQEARSDYKQATCCCRMQLQPIPRQRNEDPVPRCQTNNLFMGCYSHFKSIS